MDSRLYFTITLVVLAWLSASTCNATSHANETATNGTATNMTATNMTATNMTATNMTATNMTATNMTATTPTLIANTTVAPALVFNDTVSALEANLTNDGCGTVRLCASQPSNCNPANSTCTLLGAKAKGGNVFEFLLAGESEGYLGAVVSFDATLGGNDTTYICFNDNGQIKFTGASLENNVLTRKTVNANNVRGKITGKKIQCIFDAPVDSSTARAARAGDTALGVVSGTYNSSSGSLGAPTTLIKTDPINLSNPNQTVTNNAATATTASPNVTNMTATTPTPIANTTVAPALVFNDTVSALEANLTNDGCGTVRLCASQPSNCNPANSTCTLLGAKAKGGNVFEFLLAGESEGYLGAVVSFDATLGGNDTTYICFNDNGQIKFTGASLENNVLTRKTVNANNVRGKITGKKIQCIFDATVDSSTARAVTAPNTALGVVSGTYNSSSGSFGAPTTLIKTDPIDLSNPNQTVTNNAATATTASPNVTMTTTNTTNVTMTTTNNAMSFRQTLIQALVISAGVMGLSML